MRRAWLARLLAAGLGAAVGGGVILVPSPAFAAITGTVKVAAGSHLNIRSGPATTYSVVRSVRNGVALKVSCQVRGQRVKGSVRTTDLWNRVAAGQYVADAFVGWGSRRPAVPWCSVGATAAVSTLLNQRTNASTLLRPAGTVAARARLAIACQLGGETVAGAARTSSIWDRLTNGRFVADAFVRWPGGARPTVPWCTLGGRTPPAAGAAFIRWAAPYAQASMRRYRVPASVTLAQAILESGWGRSALTAQGNAYFGMKCFGTPGKVELGCRPYNTSECNSTCYSTRASFRVYASVSASFTDHGASLATLARYRKAFAYTRNPDRFAAELQKAGYATSPSYAKNLVALMKKYNLYRYDRLL